MKGPNFGAMTPRTRFITLVGLTLVPLAAVLIVVFLAAFAPVFTSMQSLVQTTVEIMAPLHRLQVDLHRAAMPPNDFLIHRDPGEKERFLQLSREVELQFDYLAASYPDGALERELIDQARHTWEQAHNAGLALMNHQPDSMAALDMEAFDAQLQGAANVLDTVHHAIYREVMQRAAEARKLQRRGILISSAAFLLTLLTGIGGSALLTRERRHLQSQSLTDPLTGAYNRRGFDAQLELFLRHSFLFEAQTVSVMMLDLDNFKAINDRFGHAVGDEVLRGVAVVARSHLREDDYLARIGGDEFAVLLTGLNVEQLWETAERIRAAVSAQPLVHDGEGTPVLASVTIGFAIYPASAADGCGLLVAADQALYSAKAMGRNCVAQAQPAPGQT